MPATRTLCIALLSVCPLVVAPAAAALAQSLYDDSQLPQITGKVAQYDLTPRGDIDGLILADGTEIHMSPHLSAQIAAAVRPGDTVIAHGLKARALALFQAVSLSGRESGRTVTDDGPGLLAGPPPRPGRRPPPPQAGPEATRSGTIRVVLHGPRGEANGLLLSDGTIVRLPPPVLLSMADTLRPGATIAAAGPELSNGLGTVLDARRIGTGAGDLKAIVPPPSGGRDAERPAPGSDAAPPAGDPGAPPPGGPNAPPPGGPNAPPPPDGRVAPDAPPRG